MTEIQKHRADEMTPVERKKAIEEGKSYDRVPCVPFMGELKGVLSGISVWDLSHDPEKMAEAEIIPFNRYGYDRMDIGPNSRGITEALGGKVDWNGATKEVTLSINDKEIKMTIGKTLEKYGVAPVIIDGRTFVPVRFVADELGANVAWDDATKTVTIKTAR